MDNQHKLIKGYRDLTASEIELMNEAKLLASKVGDFIEFIENNYNAQYKIDNGDGIDLRWLNIAKTDLQKGFMSLVRSIAKPTTF